MTECVYWNCGSGLVKKMSTIHDLFTPKTQVCFVSECEIVQNRCMNVFSKKDFCISLSKTIATNGKARLMCWFRDDMFERVDNLEMPGNEIIVLRSLEKKFLLVGCYRPFKLFQGESLRSNFDRLMLNLELITQTNSDIILVGDLNVNFLSKSVNHYRLTLEEWSDRNMLFQLVDMQTRQRLVADSLQTSLLDVVFTNMNGIGVRLDYSHLSDHQQLTIDLPCTPYPRGKSTIEFIDWTRYTAHAIRQLFWFHSPGVNIHLKDTNLINNRITTAICQSLNIILPKRSTTIRNSSQVVSPLIITLRNKKSKAYKRWSREKNPEALTALKVASSKLSSEVRKQKSMKIQSALCKDTKSFWSSIGNIMGKSNVFLTEPMKLSTLLLLQTCFATFSTTK